jgi:hypothetical protein
MTFRILVLTVACLVVAAPAVAASASLGAELHVPTATHDIGDSQLGVDAGGTCTLMLNRYVGLGGDVVHHYWPASPGYTAAFDRHLRRTLFESLETTDWAITALQVTGHVRLVAPAVLRCVPWIQAGAGTYRLDRNLVERKTADTYAWVLGRRLENVVSVPGVNGTLGLDYRGGLPVVVGLDATLHRVWSHDQDWFGDKDMPDFSALTVGAHVLYQWGGRSARSAR